MGVGFSEKELQIVTLSSVDEYITEGKLLYHCVFVNDYHLKKNTLILSARVEGVPVETIELSLEDYKVLQSRGKFNQNSLYHERILQLVKTNTHLIERRAKGVKMLKKQQQ